MALLAGRRNWFGFGAGGGGGKTKPGAAGAAKAAAAEKPAVEMPKPGTKITI